jgi:hypothetical protein
MDQAHIAGVCWCDRFHHCSHLNRLKEDPYRWEICCWCGQEMAILHTRPVEDHGPHAPWLYLAQHIAPEDDLCPGIVESESEFAEGELNAIVNSGGAIFR